MATLNAPSKDIADYLDADSDLDLAIGTNLFRSTMPPTPDLCACLYDSPGEAPDSHLDYKRPGLQIVVRGVAGGYDAAHTLAQQLNDAIDGLANVTISGSRYIGIWATTDVGAVGQDDNNRPLVSVNFRIHRTASS